MQYGRHSPQVTSPHMYTLPKFKINLAVTVSICMQAFPRWGSYSEEKWTLSLRGGGLILEKCGPLYYTSYGSSFCPKAKGGGRQPPPPPGYGPDLHH